MIYLFTQHIIVHKCHRKKISVKIQCNEKLENLNLKWNSKSKISDSRKSVRRYRYLITFM